MILDLVPKTIGYLQPNPGIYIFNNKGYFLRFSCDFCHLFSFFVLQAYRAKLSMLNTVSKMRGQVKASGYPQTEGILGDCMLYYGNELGAESGFGMFKTKNEARCFLLL